MDWDSALTVEEIKSSEPLETGTYVAVVRNVEKGYSQNKGCPMAVMELDVLHRTNGSISTRTVKDWLLINKDESGQLNKKLNAFIHAYCNVRPGQQVKIWEEINPDKAFFVDILAEEYTDKTGEKRMGNKVKWYVPRSSITPSMRDMAESLMNEVTGSKPEPEPEANTDPQDDSDLPF
jgi:hypothetical protein